MRKFSLTILLSLLLVSQAFAQVKSAKLDLTLQYQKAMTGCINPVIRGQVVFMADSSEPKFSNVGIIEVETELQSFTYLATDEKRNPVELEAKGKQLFITRPGTTWVIIFGVTPDNVPTMGQMIVTLGDTPAPQPDVPDTDDGVTGFRVLIIRETSIFLPPKQQAILSSPIVRGYLDAKTVKKDGQPEWRIFDPQSQPDDPVWGPWLKKERDSLPWIIVSNDQKRFEGPLPANVEDTMKLLKEYGN